MYVNNLNFFMLYMNYHGSLIFKILYKNDKDETFNPMSRWKTKNFIWEHPHINLRNIYNTGKFLMWRHNETYFYMFASSFVQTNDSFCSLDLLSCL